jgi:DNA polymerase-3 subunit epsilon
MKISIDSESLEILLASYQKENNAYFEQEWYHECVRALVNAPDPRPMPEILGFKLLRPLVTFDLETTGLDVINDRIISLGYHKYYPTTGADPVIESGTWYFNPGREIPKEASDVHGITTKQVLEFNWPLFANEFKIVAALFEGADVCTFNGNHYDIQLLSEEFGRCGISWPKPGMKSIDVKNIFIKKQPRSLPDAHQFYLGEEMVGNHDAGADTQATFDVLLAMLARYPDLAEMNVSQLHEFSSMDPFAVDLAGKISLDAEGDYIYTFGKHKGKKIKNEASYARWMLDSDFPSNTKAWLDKILDLCCRSYQ